MGFFSKPKLRHAQRKIGETVTDICCVRATLMGRSYFGQSPPRFFSGAKKIKMAPMGTFCFVTLNLRNPQWRSGKLLRIYISHMVLTNACPRFGGPSPILTGGKKTFLATFSTRVTIGGLLVHNGEEYRKLKKCYALTDYD